MSVCVSVCLSVCVCVYISRNARSQRSSRVHSGARATPTRIKIQFPTLKHEKYDKAGTAFMTRSRHILLLEQQHTEVCFSSNHLHVVTI